MFEETTIITDEFEEAVSALEMACESVARSSEDIYQWKWAIIAVHSAVQGFLVLALRGTDGLRILDKKSAKKWHIADESNGLIPYPKERLDTFLHLYKKAQNTNMMKQYIHSKVLKPTHDQNQSIRFINRLRNEFIHFLPKGWTIEVSGLPHIFEDCLAVIEFLGWECGNVFWIDREDVSSRAQDALLLCRRHLQELS